MTGLREVGRPPLCSEEALRRIVTMRVLDGTSFGLIADTLNRDGVSTGTGKVWGRQHVHQAFTTRRGSRLAQVLKLAQV